MAQASVGEDTRHPDALALPALALHEVLLDASADVRLMREFLEACVETYDFVSFPKANFEEERDHHVFQVLSKSTKLVRVQCFDSQGHGQDLMWTLQHFEMWRGQEVVMEPSHMEVFCTSEPVGGDMLRLLGTNPGLRPLIKIWKEGVSDLDGCKLLTEPRVLAYKKPLSDPRVPILALVDELTSKRYVGVRRQLTHSRTSAKSFDLRDLPSKRCYLQVLVAAPRFSEQACQRFRAGVRRCFISAS